MQQIIIPVIISYLIGSIPTAYILAKLVKGIDIRQFGSGNVGATNTFRVLGKGWGILVLIIDVVKGVVPVVLIADYFNPVNTFISDNMLRIILGIVSVCGHNWTIFLKFKGGKGVATTFGVLLGLALKVPGIKLIFGLTLLTWIAVVFIFRRISVASILGSLALPLFMAIYKQPKELIVMGIILCLFIIWRHRPNIIKLIRGEEKPINFSKHETLP